MSIEGGAGRRWSVEAAGGKLKYLVDLFARNVELAAFAQVSQAQLYVSMSRARRSMHLLTDCKEALHEAVCRPSERISPLELSAEYAFKRDIISLDRVHKQVQAHIPPIERQAWDHGIDVENENF